MRSIFLIFPSRAGFDAALSSDADALAVDLSPAAPEEAEALRRRAAELIVLARERGRACLVKIHALASGLADGDLDAVMAARPDGVILPGAHGGRDVQHLGAKLAVREAENDLPDGFGKILALGADSAAALFELGSFVRATRRMIGIGRDEQALAKSLGLGTWREGEAPEPLRVARSLCLFAAHAAGAPAYDCAETVDCEGFERLCAQAARDGFAGKFVVSAAQAEIANAAFVRTS
jgi:citrate lyase subunit beta/citryl-CoA lyase